MMFELKPVTKHIIWGGERLSRDYGMGEKGEKIAEAWELTCRGDGDNEIISGKYTGRLLSEFVRENPQSLGTKQKGDRFPLLIKLIDAEADLSIQVHPDDEYALSHTDDMGKTEMWYIVDAKPGAKLIYGLKRKYTRDELKTAIAAGTLESLMNYVEVKSCARAFIDHMVAKGDIDYSHIGLAYSVGLSEELRDDMEVYAHDLGFKDVTWTQVGGVISSHCGPTAFGAVLTLKA